MARRTLDPPQPTRPLMAESLQIPRTTEPEPSTSPANGGHPIVVEVKVRLQAIALPEAGGGYSVIVPALPGCVTQGETIEEVQANVIEAAEGWLAVGHDRNKDEDIRVARGEA